MKRAVISIVVLVLALALCVPLALPVSASPDLVGRLISDGSNSKFRGDIQLLSDGTVTGKWQWNFIEYPGLYVQFHSEQITSLMFPTDNVAVLTGRFVSRVYPNDFLNLGSSVIELSFQITDVPGSAVHPVGILVPLGMKYPNVGNDLVDVYDSGLGLIAAERIDCQVQVFR